MTYLDGPRFVVRELEGFANHAVGGGHNPGLGITVHDRAYCGLVVASWRTEDYMQGNAAVWLKRAGMRTDAALLAAELNAK